LRAPVSPLSPYTTLFRSHVVHRPRRRPRHVLARRFIDRAMAGAGKLPPGRIPRHRAPQVRALPVESDKAFGKARQIELAVAKPRDRKSTRLNSSHVKISY